MGILGIRLYCDGYISTIIDTIFGQISTSGKTFLSMSGKDIYIAVKFICINLVQYKM